MTVIISDQLGKYISEVLHRSCPSASEVTTMWCFINEIVSITINGKNTGGQYKKTWQTVVMMN